MSKRGAAAIFATALAFATATFAFGCGDDDPDPAPTIEASPPVTSTAVESPTAIPTPVPTPTVAPSPTPRTGSNTGVQVVDVFVKALFSKDVTRVLPLIDYKDVECTTTPQGIGSPPICPAGQTTGSLVKAITASSCEGGYIVEPEVRRALEPTITTRVVELFSIAKIASGGYAVAIRLAFVAGQSGPPPGVLYTLSEKGLTSYAFGCGISVRALAAHSTDYLVPPPPLAPPPADTPKTGVQQIDDVISALVTMDVVRLAAMTKVQKVACGVDGTVPRCGEGVAPGTPADAVEIRTCRSFFYGPGGLAADYDLRFGPAPKVLAVAKGSGDIAYWVIANTATQPGQEAAAGRALGIDGSGKIAVIDGGCSESAAKVAARFTDFLLPPK